MTDVLIRNVTPRDIEALDDLARRLGVSRAELLHQEITSLARRSTITPTQEMLSSVGDLFSDVLAPEVMERAWR